jgi:hypothetical protein
VSRRAQGDGDDGADDAFGRRLTDWGEPGALVIISMPGTNPHESAAGQSAAHSVITERIPNYIEGVTPRVARFDSAAALLAIDFVAKWRDDPLGFGPFEQFSIAEEGAEYSLMAEFNDGREWWVVGRLKLPNLAMIDGLNRWEPPDERESST